MLQPLTTPRNLVLTPLYGGVILSWDAPDGGAPATEFYVVSVDGIAVEMLTDTTLFLALDANEHSISIVAGNRFTFGPKASVTVELSRSLEIVSPADGTLIRPGTVNVEWTYSEGADIASRFLVIVNGEELEADDDASSMDLLLKVGSYTVEVRAIDVNGDYISEQISFLVSADYDDGVFEYTLTGEMGDGPAVITGYIGLGGDVIIPATLGGKPVAAIGDGAFGGNDDITSLTLPASVTSIADGAFLGCSSLEAFVVSPTNPSYGSIDGVLLSKDGTTLIQYPAGLGGESYTVPEGVTQIEGGAFRSCRSLEIILIPASVTTIGEGAFFDCDLLADIYFCGDAPTVGGNLLSDGSELRAWWYEGKSGFVHEGIWAGVYTAMLEAPTAPTGLTLTPLYNGVFLSWESPEGEGSFPVEFYIVSIGGVEVETLTGTTLLLELDVDEYSIGVAAGNRFIIGLEASVAVDLSRELEITGHSGGSLIRPGTVTIQWSYDESSGMVDHFLVILDGVEEQLPSDARSHELTLKVGERVIKVEAVDSRGGSILDQIALMVSADYDDGVFKYTLTGEMGDGPAVITGYIGTGGDVTIPANLGGQPVEAIGDGAFAGCTSLETLRIGAGVKDIGAGILDGCTALSSVHFDGDAPTVDGDLSDQDGFTVYYSEGAQGFSSTWAGATTQAVFPPSGEGDDGFYPILIGAVALLVILGVAIILIRRR